jgi:hypothetical protein
MKILSTQIIKYLNEYKILYSGQHGFTNEHSCETVLHEILTNMNKIRSLREIGMFLLGKTSFLPLKCLNFALKNTYEYKKSNRI